MQMEGVEITKIPMPIEECALQKLNYLSDALVSSSCLCLPNEKAVVLVDFLKSQFDSTSLPSKVSFVRFNSKASKVATVTSQALILFRFEPPLRLIKQTTTDLKLKIKDVAWHPILPTVLLVSFVNKIVLYETNSTEPTQIFSHEIAHIVECRWNKHGDVLICTTSEEIIALEWKFEKDENSPRIDWSQYQKHELLTCRSMKNIVFNGNDDLFWTYSTPNLTIPNKETLLASKKQQKTLGEDLIIRPSTDGTKSLGFLDSLTNISSKLLSEAEEIETESDEITKELPRIHFIKFDRSTSRLYELYSLDQSNITPYSMMDYNEQKRILLLGSKQKVDLFDCTNNENTPVYIKTLDLPSTLLGLKSEDNYAVLFLGQQKTSSNSGASFLSFDTTTKYTNLEVWNVTLPNMEKSATTVAPSTPNIVSTNTAAILQAIQGLKLLVEDQYRRVNERLDRLEAAMNLSTRQ